MRAPLSSPQSSGAPQSARRVLQRVSRSPLAHCTGVLAAVLLMASDAAAERISVLSFEGDNARAARALRWRVAGALKRAGHSVVGSVPPRDPDDAEQLRAYARRRRVDMFVAGSAEGGRGSWELTLTVKDADGETVGSALTFSGSTLREVLKEIRSEGPDRLDSALSGRASATGRSQRDIDLDGPAADDPADDGAGDRKKKRARAVAEPIDLDAEPGAEPASDDASESSESDEAADEAGGEDNPRTSDAKGWAKADEEPPEDDGRASFLSGDGEASDEPGLDDGGEDEGDAASATKDPTVLLGLNAGFVRRTLAYADDLYGRLRAPNVNTWVYRLQAEVYPFARPVKNRIGLIAGYEGEFSGVVRDNDAGTDFGVTFSELYGGLKLRQPLGKHEIALEGTVGSLQAGLDDPDGISGVPEIDYTSLRAALDVGLQFGALSMRGALGYRLPLGGFGQASEAEWFPRMEAYGMEGSLGMQYRISQEVAFDISGSMRRYVLTMNSQPSDALGGVAEVAGGAVDLYLGGYFGLSFTL